MEQSLGREIEPSGDGDEPVTLAHKQLGVLVAAARDSREPIANSVQVIKYSRYRDQVQAQGPCLSDLECDYYFNVL